MATKPNDSAYRHAQNLIEEGQYVLDQRDDWSEHQPSAGTENSFIEEHGWNEHQKWSLTVDEEEPENTKARYKFPYGDFENVHRCGVISAESRAGRYHNYDVERPAQLAAVRAASRVYGVKAIADELKVRQTQGTSMTPKSPGRSPTSWGGTRRFPTTSWRPGYRVGG
jgi:hypothetical protein